MLVVIVTMQPEGLYVREKGKRTTYGPLSWDFLLRRGVDLEIQRRGEVRAEKNGGRHQTQFRSHPVRII